MNSPLTSRPGHLSARQPDLRAFTLKPYQTGAHLPASVDWLYTDPNFARPERAPHIYFDDVLSDIPNYIRLDTTADDPFVVIASKRLRPNEIPRFVRIRALKPKFQESFT
jgi:hypothetical protein